MKKTKLVVIEVEVVMWSNVPYLIRKDHWINKEHVLECKLKDHHFTAFHIPDNIEERDYLDEWLMNEYPGIEDAEHFFICFDEVENG